MFGSLISWGCFGFLVTDIFELTCILIEVHVALGEQHPCSIYFTLIALVSQTALV